MLPSQPAGRRRSHARARAAQIAMILLRPRSGGTPRAQPAMAYGQIIAPRDDFRKKGRLGARSGNCATKRIGS